VHGVVFDQLQFKCLESNYTVKTMNSFMMA